MQPRIQRQPSYINVCESIQELHADKIKQIPVAEAEQLIAKHRQIESFTWIEDFSTEEIPDLKDNEYRNKLIHPDKLAICYFGTDVGYGTVAIADIMPGECIVFTGEIIEPQLSQQMDGANPFLCSSGPNFFVDAKHKGGYASMVLDVPRVNEMLSLAKKNVDVSNILTANIEPEIIEVKGDTDIFIMESKMLIPKGTLLGSSYEGNMRLLYKNFIGFNRNGERLPVEVNAKLNWVIYKNIALNMLTNDEINLYKILKRLEKRKYSKALTHLENNLHLIAELITNEIAHLIPDSNSTTKSLLLHENTLRQTVSRNFSLRRVVDQITRIRTKMLEHKGNGCMQMLGNNISENYVVYPNMESDMFELAEMVVARGEFSRAKNYYNASRLFAIKNHNESTDLKINIVEALEQLKIT